MLQTTHETLNERWRHRFAVLTACATFVLLGVGGLVTSHGAGLAVPDWPNSYGYNMFAFPVSLWIGGILYEHTHRLWASFVGLLTLVLALWLCGTKSRPWLRASGAAALLLGLVLLPNERVRLDNDLFLCGVGAVAVATSFVWPRCVPAETWLRRLGLIALALVIVQGVLGGLRVVKLKDELGIVHATLAQLFFALMCALALFTSRGWREAKHPPARAMSARERGWFLGATILIFLQLVVGATMRHQHAGLAVPDFPLAYGKVWPAMDAASVERINQQRTDARDFRPVTAFQIGLHMVHRIGAVLVLLAVLGSALAVWRPAGRPPLFRRLSLTWLGLVVAQWVLGALTVIRNKPADIATLHVMFGAAALAAGVVLTILAFRCAPARVGAAASPPASEWETASEPKPDGVATAV